MRRSSASALSLAILLLLLLGAVSVLAQDEEDEEEDSATTAVLSAYGDAKGALRVTFYSPADINEMPVIAEALGSMFHCAPSEFQSPVYPTRNERTRTLQGTVSAHQLTANCPGVVQHRGLRSAVDVPLAQLLTVLRQNNITQVALNLSFPELRNPQVEPHHLLVVGAGYHDLLTFVIPVETKEAAIHIEWGFQRSDVIGATASAAIFILLPSGLILWMRSRALRLHNTDRAAAWFSYIHTQNLCMTAAFLVWIGGGNSTRNTLSSMLSSITGPSSQMGGLLLLLYIYAPITIVLLVNVLASYRVMVEVRQIQWTFAEYLQLQFAQVGILLFPLMGMLVGIQMLAAYHVLAWAIIAVSVGMIPLSVRLRRKLTGSYPEPVTSGEFHDRILRLGRRAGVAIKHIFVLPSGKLPMANAFAASNGTVMVTDYILQKLNRREVEAVAAHEIGHLQYGHPKKLGAGILMVLLAPFVLRSILSPLFSMTTLFLPGYPRSVPSGLVNSAWHPELDFVISIVALLLFYGMARRFERIADARSVTLTEDPEALITAFAKLSLINLTPLQWGRTSGTLTTHPSTLKRIHKIAEVGNVPEARVQQLLALTSLTPAEGESAIPIFDSPKPASEYVYSPREQLQRAYASALILIAVPTLIPILFSLAAARLGTFGRAWPLLLAGVLVTFVGYLLTMLGRTVSGRRKLLERFRARMKERYPQLDFSEAHLVGYSPEAWPRFYYVQPHWDTGLLIPNREGLLYLGDQAQFLLPYPAIRECVFEPGSPGWLKLRRTYIRWELEGVRGSMNLAALDPCSMFAIESSNRNLHEAVLRWQAQPESLSPAPAECVTLPAPSTPILSGKKPNDAYSWKSMLKAFVPSLVAGTLVGNALLSLSLVGGVTAILYVPAVVLLLRLLEWLPYASYKDRALTGEWSSKVVEKWVAKS